MASGTRNLYPDLTEMINSVLPSPVDVAISQEDFHKLLAVTSLNANQYEAAKLWFTSEAKTLKSVARQIGTTDRVVTSMFLSLRTELEKPDVQELLMALLDERDYDDGKYERKARICSLYREHPKQIGLLRDVIESDADRLLTMQEWDKVLGAVGLLRDEYRLYREVFFEYYGVTGREKQLESISQEMGVERQVINGVYSCILSRLRKEKNREAKEAVRLILEGTPELVEAHDGHRKTHKSQLDILSEIVGYRVTKRLTKENWDVLVSYMVLSQEHTDALYAYFGINNGNVELTVPETARLIGKSKGCVENMRNIIIRQLSSDELKPILTRMLQDDGFVGKEVDIPTINPEQELLRRRSPKHVYLLQNLMGWDVERILNEDEWTQVFDAVKMNDPEWRKVFWEYYGVRDGIEKMGRDIAACLGKTVAEVKMVTNKILNYLKYHKIKVIQVINGFYDDEYKSLIPEQLVYKKLNATQLALLSRIVGKQVTEPLSQEHWESILTALRWRDDDKMHFHFYYGTDGKGELLLCEVKERMESETGHEYKDSDMRVIFYRIQSSLYRHTDEIRDTLLAYYDGKPFDTRNIGRSAQKRMLARLCELEVEKSPVVLTGEQWDSVLKPLGVSLELRKAFYMNYGIGKFPETEFKLIAKKMRLSEYDRSKGPKTYFFGHINLISVQGKIRDYIRLNMEQGLPPVGSTGLEPIKSKSSIKKIEKNGQQKSGVLPPCTAKEAQLNFLSVVCDIKPVKCLSLEQWSNILSVAGVTGVSASIVMDCCGLDGKTFLTREDAASKYKKKKNYIDSILFTAEGLLYMDIPGQLISAYMNDNTHKIDSILNYMKRG